tara:strand:+ start:1013 stop:1288 length:276 start_codon:yes stop_codon:yes gene_type:complete
MSEVTPCCGCSYEESWISDCCQLETQTKYFLETDSIEKICDSCNHIAECSGYICNECGNWTETLEERSEYRARMKENYYEEMADARRKYGE